MRAVSLLVTLAGIVALALAPTALADEAGDDIAHPAGPVTGTASGTLDSGTDADWWVVYTNPSRALNIAVTNVGTAGCGRIDVWLRNADGHAEQGGFLDPDRTRNFNFTSPATPARYYVWIDAVSQCGQVACQISVDPPEAFTATAPYPQPGPTSADETEPNDSRTQATGPVAGATAYRGTMGSDTDIDWWRFHTNLQKFLDIAVTKVG